MDIVTTIMDFMTLTSLFELCEKDPDLKTLKDYWRLRYKKDFGSTLDLKVTDPFLTYALEVERRTHPLLETVVRTWEKNPTQVLDFSVVSYDSKLRWWPFALRGKEAKIINLKASCNLLKTIPNLPNCLHLDIRDNPLIQLPPLARCVQLDCSMCDLKELPELTKCVILDCSFNLLEKLPGVAKCEILRCRGNQLPELPTLASCRILDCSRNTLTSLPPLQNVKRYNLCDFSDNSFPPGYNHRFVDPTPYTRKPRLY